MSMVESKIAGFDRLSGEVIGAGLCTGCGTCVGVCPRRCIVFDYGLEQPVLSGQCKPCGLCCGVCPGKDVPLSAMGQSLFSRERQWETEPLGFSLRRLKGYACDQAVRQAGTSGGLTTALLIHALETGRIDGAIVVGMSAEHPWRAEPKLATTRAEILGAAKSKYVVVPNNALLAEVERRGIRRLGVVGTACHIHGLRKMQALGKPKPLVSRIELALGIFCGANWSYKVTEYLIEKLTGVPLAGIASFNYRGGPRSQDTVIVTKDGETKTMPYSSAARSFLLSRLPRDRCGMCLDFSAELADVSLGDIFLPARAGRLPKVSAVIVRTRRGEQLVDAACRDDHIRVSPLPESGFSHNHGLEIKRHIVPYLLSERKRLGQYVPDYDFRFEYRPPAFADEKAATNQQMKDIPEIAEWYKQKF